MHVKSKHEVSILESTLYQCEECEYNTSKKDSLAIHRESKHESDETHLKWLKSIQEEKSYPCDECEYTYGRKKHLDQHKQDKHKKQNEHTCKQCVFSGPSKQQLRRHVESVHEHASYPCGECDYKSGRKDHLYEHVKSKHKH